MLSNLQAGTYSVTVTDSLGCSNIAELVIESPTALEISLDGPTVLCSGTGGSTLASAGGGTPPYAYVWNNGSSGPELLSPAGTYTVTVFDGQGCQQTQTLTIAESSPVDLSADIQNATAMLLLMAPF